MFTHSDQEQQFEKFELHFYQYILIMIFLLSKQSVKKEVLKLEIQILTFLWFTGEIVVNSMAKFRGYHAVVIIKFLIF